MKCVVCLKKSLCLYSIWSSLPIANCHMHAAWHLLAVAVATVHLRWVARLATGHNTRNYVITSNHRF